MDRSHMKLVLFDAIMAVAIVVLYSPGLLALRPDDPDFLRAGSSIFFGIIVLVALIAVNFEALRPAKRQHMALSGAVDVADLTAVLRRFEGADVVGCFAKDAIAELESGDKKRAMLIEAITRKFERNSMSWDKFMAVVDAATQTLNRNAAYLANRVQTFDAEGYRTLQHLINSGEYKRDNIPDDVQEEKWQLLENSLHDMRGAIAANEKLLLEMDKFAMEIGQLESSENVAGNEAMLEEIRTLVDETKYYR